LLGAAVLAASLNTVAGLTALWLSRLAGEQDWVAEPGEGTTTSPRLSGVGRRVLAAASLSGAALLALEVIWFRFLAMFVVTGTLAFSMMLAVVLVGIGTGGLVASKILERRACASRFLPIIAWAQAICCVVAYAGFQIGSASGSRADDWLAMLTLSLRLILPVSLLSGFLFTFQGEALREEIPDETRAAGFLTLANTLGGAVGSFLAGFVLLPYLGMEASFFLIALVYLLIGVLLLKKTVLVGVQKAPRLVVGAGIVVAIAIIAFPFGLMEKTYFPMSARIFQADGSKIVASREGKTETILYLRGDLMDKPIYYRLVTDGYSMASNGIMSRRYMGLFAYWPKALHKEPIKDALLMCFGVGVTAKAVTTIKEAEHIDVVDISKDILEMSNVIYAPDQQPLNDPRVKVHIEDGRYFLQTTDGKYDLITGEPPPPRRPGTVNLYTREHFQLMYDHLKEGGMVTYWIPIADLLESDTKTIVRSFCDVFEDCSLWNGTTVDWMLVGTRHATATGPVSKDTFERQWRDPEMLAELQAIGIEQPEQLGALFIGDSSYLREMTASAPPLVDNYPKRLAPLYHPATNDRYQFYTAVLGIARPAATFATSAFIRSLWPEDYIEKSVPFFHIQDVFNHMAFELPPFDSGRNPIRTMGAVDSLLTKTSLQTAPLWLLGANDMQMQLVRSGADDGTGVAEYLRGLSALVDRNYAQAATELRIAVSKRPGDTVAGPCLVYALQMSGDVEGARGVASTIRSALGSSEDVQQFWSFMDERLGTTSARQVGP
jgi:spermidine synthase